LGEQAQNLREDQVNQILGDLKETIPESEPLEIVPHKDAPLFDPEKANPRENLTRALEIFHTGGDVGPHRDLLRQAGLVNLWIFTKYIAGYSGPFNLLTPHLHASMANFRQRLLTPGTRGALFIPRGHFKSSLITEAASAWEIIRWPNIRIRITNAIAAKAEDFMHSIRNIFDDNPLMEFLYPEFYVSRPNVQPRWSETEMVSPARTRKFREATVEAGGVGGASEGHHYDLHLVDDLIGLKSLTSMQAASAEMIKARNWFWASEKSLLVSMRDSRVVVIGTRYAEDDVYSDILNRAYALEGGNVPDFEPNPDGRWVVYYRFVAEDGQIIFPENFTAGSLREMARDDWWTLVTQYFNWPQAAGLAELSDYPPKRCWLSRENNEWIITRWSGGEEINVPLSVMDVIQAEDPAATERYTSAKTSRTAWGVLATDEEENVYVIDLRADYVPPDVAIDWLFLGREKWPIRASFLEMQGAFKMLGPMVRGEEAKRGKWLNLRAANAGTDKDARIRTTLQPVLSKGKLFTDDNCYDLLWEELRSFPQSVRKDIMDMVSLGMGYLNKPLTEREEKQRKEAGKRWSRRAAANAAGY